MKAEIISTGDEVITGMIDDTNTSWLSQQLLSLGIQVTRRSTVGDDLNDLIDVLSERIKILRSYNFQWWLRTYYR